MVEINLLQGQKKAPSQVNIPVSALSGKLVLWALAGLLVVEFVIFGGLYYWRRGIVSETQDQERQIADVQSQLNSLQSELREAVLSQASLKKFSSLLDQHIYWTRVWNDLAENTLKTAVFDSIQASSENGEFILTGTVKNYTELGKLMLGLESAEGFRKVELLSASSDEEDGTVLFDIKVVIDPRLLLQTAEVSPKESGGGESGGE